MMKKKLLLLLFPLLLSGLTGCVKYNGRPKSSQKDNTPGGESSSIIPDERTSAPDQSSAPDQGGSGDSGGGNVNPQPQPQPASDELPAGTAVKVYLVFGAYGLYKGNAVNSTVDALFLEHAMELDAKVGDVLPNSTDVTSSVADSKFVCWTSYNNDGKLTEYLKVPGYNNKVLYASFSGGSAGGVNPGGTGGGGQIVPSTPDPVNPPETGNLPASGYGFLFGDNSYMEAVHTNDFDGFSQYLIENKSFSLNQTFQLYDFGEKAGWTVDIDPYSFGGDSATSQNWKTYLMRDYTNNTYKVLQDFSIEAVYIKLKYGADQIYFQLKA